MTTLSKGHCMHRRTVLLRSLIGAAAAGLALNATPAHSKSFKATKKQAGYISRNKPSTQMCVQCGFYINPYDCAIVEGPVSPWGWCNYYED